MQSLFDMTCQGLDHHAGINEDHTLMCNLQNWAAETKKWLGDERIKALVVQAGPEAKGQVITSYFW